MFGRYSSFGKVKTTLAPGAAWPHQDPASALQPTPGISVGEKTKRFKVLQHIKNHPGCKTPEVASGVAMKQNSVTRAVEFLAAHRFIRAVRGLDRWCCFYAN